MLDLVLKGAHLATCDGAGSAAEQLDRRPDAAVGVEGGHVAWIGPSAEAPVAREVRELDGTALLPGLVDPHTHLVFAGSRVEEFTRRMGGEDYRTIAAEGGGIASTVRATREASEEQLFALAKARAEALRARGVTSVEVKSGYGLTTESELRLLRVARRIEAEGVLRVTTSFLGAHAVPPERRGERARYVDEVVGEQLPAVAEAGLADAVDVYCDDGAFTLAETRRILEAAKGRGLKVRAHVGQFADLGGPALLAELGGLSGDHLEAIDEAGLSAMAEAGVVAVLLPGAWRTLRQEAPRAERFRAAGVPMAVGTDLNPGTSPTTDLPLCAALAVRDAGMTVEEALLGVTRVAARAAGFEEGVGRVRVGAPADLAAFPVQDPRALPYALGGLGASLVVRAGAVVAEGPPAPVF